MTPQEWLAVITAAGIVGGLVGQVVNWIFRSGFRKAEEEEKEADAGQKVAEAAVQLIQPYVTANARLAERVQHQDEEIISLKAKVKGMPELEKKVAGLLKKCGEYEVELAEARRRNRSMRQRLESMAAYLQNTDYNGDTGPLDPGDENE